MARISGFQDFYRSAGLYDEILPPHLFGGMEDVELVARVMNSHYGSPVELPVLRILELGCGTGRVTASLAPYAARLVAVDSSPVMIEAFRDKYSYADARCLDTREAVEGMLLVEELDARFDVIGAFWSLSYPLGECFEKMTVDGIRPFSDYAVARDRAAELVKNLVRLLAPGGHLLVLFFDSDTLEQRLVTRLWERIAPFPPGGRGYTRQILVDELRAAEDRGEGWLTHTRFGGVACLRTKQAASAWFSHAHLKDLPALVDSPEVQEEIRCFVDICTQPSGEVIIPSGVHLLDFHAAHQPANWRR